MSTTQTTHDELQIQEFIRRQRLRAESFCCTPRRAFSPYPPPPTIPKLRPPPSSPSPWIQHRALFLITLILLTSFHLFLSAPLQPFRFRTHAATSTRLHFLTTILPSALLHPTPKTPRPPFSNLTHLPALYPLSATASFHHLLALHAPCTTLIHSLAHTRHASHTATHALTHLHAAALHTNTTRHLAPPIDAVRTALSSLTRTSERWALHASLLAAEEGLEAVLQTGVGAQRALATPTKAQTWWRGSSSTVGGKKRVERAARLRTACAAAAFGRTLDEVEGRLPGMVGMGEEAKRAVGAVDRAVLGVCRGAVDVVGDTNLVCADALARLWRMLEPRGSGSVRSLELIRETAMKVGEAADPLLARLEAIKDELEVQREGLDIWAMFLETLPGGSVEEKCQP